MAQNPPKNAPRLRSSISARSSWPRFSSSWRHGGTGNVRDFSPWLGSENSQESWGKYGKYRKIWGKYCFSRGFGGTKKNFQTLTHLGIYKCPVSKTGGYPKDSDVYGNNEKPFNLQAPYSHRHRWHAVVHIAVSTNYRQDMCQSEYCLQIQHKKNTIQ